MIETNERISATVGKTMWLDYSKKKKNKTKQNNQYFEATFITFKVSYEILHRII